MKMGTKSVIFGAHCFFLHPWFVALAWWRLYGFPWNPRLWVAFFVHDLGYWGKPNMDGPEGEMHPWLGARWMSYLFDGKRKLWKKGEPSEGRLVRAGWMRMTGHPCPEQDNGWIGPWGRFSLLHSRFLAKRYQSKPSRLCVADKLAIVLTPTWLYLPMVIATGEIHEYRALAEATSPGSQYTNSHGDWCASMKAYVQDWVNEHKDGREDTWTPSKRKPRDGSGVWN